MEKDFENAYYHGLAGFIVVYNPQTIVKTALEQLEMILKNKAILSRNMLNREGINYLKHKGVYNGDDYISVCVKHFPKEEMEGVNEGFDSSYEKYTNNTISIIIDKNIENICEFRTGNYDYLPGERQVKDYIGIENFIGIKVEFGFDELNKVVAEMVYELLNKYNVNLPIIDGNNSVLINNENVNRLGRK